MSIQNPIDIRRTAFLRSQATRDFSNDATGAAALCNLSLGIYIHESNEKLRAVANWYVLPHPKGRDPHGECDFAAIKLAWAYHLFHASGLLEAQTLAAIKEYFLGYDFQSKYTSENHQLLFHTSRYLMACVYPDEVFGRYGLTGAQLKTLENDYLLDFIQYRAKRGWDEFDSGCYLAPAFEALLALYEFAEDERLRLGAKMMLHVRLMDVVHESLEGMHGGAHGRIYERHALDHRKECSYFLQALYFGNVPYDADNVIVEALLSTFVPDPLLENVLHGRCDPYEVRERVHLHCSTYKAPQRPLKHEDASLRKLTYVTRSYVLGTVQWQDPYQEGSLAAWRSGHEQMDWDLTIAGGDTRRRIFTQHPGHNGAEGAEHGYWTGDLFCNCSSHFQQGPVSLSLYEIPEGEPYQWIHAYFPQALFDNVVMEGTAIYAQSGDVYVMLLFSQDFTVTQEGPWKGVELICPGNRVAVAAEAADRNAFVSFDAFIKAMKQNQMQLDRQRMRLEYRSARAGTLVLTREDRLVNGMRADLDYATYDSPYLFAPWDSGVITLLYGKTKILCDFINWHMEKKDG